MTQQFQPESENSPADQPAFVDPKPTDFSEEQFAASADAPAGQPHFALTNADEDSGQAKELAARGQAAANNSARESPESSSVSGSWRQEVAERVSIYRSRRRPRGPRYPSLHLNFEPQPLPYKEDPEIVAAFAHADEGSCARQPEQPAPISNPQPPDERTNVILFPRPVIAPPAVSDELAEPVQDLLRIIEAPELVPPPPALGGILIPEEQENVSERRPGFEIPLQSARMSRRLVAAAIDAIIVLSAVALFAYVFFEITAVRLPVRSVMLAVGGLAVLCWAGYQYLLIVYAGSTAGLKLTRLHLARFDGGSTSRNLRRWRVLASILSGASLGLGFAWCFLDEDQLCWHDRITKTYVAPSDIAKSTRNR